MGLSGSTRGAFFGNLTAEQAEEFLTMATFHLLAGHAYVSFPESTASRPSRYVEILAGAKYATIIHTPFPVRLNLKQYRSALLPVLLDAQNQTQRPVNLAAIQQGDPMRQQFIERLGKRIRQSFAAAGY